MVNVERCVFIILTPYSSFTPGIEPGTCGLEVSNTTDCPTAAPRKMYFEVKWMKCFSTCITDEML